MWSAQYTLSALSICFLCISLLIYAESSDITCRGKGHLGLQLWQISTHSFGVRRSQALRPCWQTLNAAPSGQRQSPQRVSLEDRHRHLNYKAQLSAHLCDVMVSSGLSVHMVQFLLGNRVMVTCCSGAADGGHKTSSKVKLSLRLKNKGD